MFLYLESHGFSCSGPLQEGCSGDFCGVFAAGQELVPDVFECGGENVQVVLSTNVQLDDSLGHVKSSPMLSMSYPRPVAAPRRVG